MIKIKPLTKNGNGKRGRPVTGNAMTNAQRQAKFKALKKQTKTDAEWLAETVGADG